MIQTRPSPGGTSIRLFVQKVVKVALLFLTRAWSGAFKCGPAQAVPGVGPPGQRELKGRRERRVSQFFTAWSKK